MPEYAIFILMFAVGCAGVSTRSDRLSGFNLAEEFNPAWHRGDFAKGQENCETALRAALESEYPHVEVDVIYFEDNTGKQQGLLSHELTMKRLTGKEGNYSSYRGVENLPLCNINKQLAPEKFITLLDFLDLLKEYKRQGIPVLATLDLKEDTDKGEMFGRWVGRQLVDYGLQKDVFVVSFFHSNIKGVKRICPECLHSGYLYEDHWFLGLLPTSVTIFDIFHPFSEIKNVNIINIQDKIFFRNPRIAEYWKKKRRVTFVGMFSSDPERIYTEEEFQTIIRYTRWGEFDPIQMEAYREFIRQSKP